MWPNYDHKRKRKLLKLFEGLCDTYPHAHLKKERAHQQFDHLDTIYWTTSNRATVRRGENKLLVNKPYKTNSLQRVRSGPESSPRASVGLVIKIKCLTIVEMRKAHHIIRGD